MSCRGGWFDHLIKDLCVKRCWETNLIHTHLVFIIHWLLLNPRKVVQLECFINIDIGFFSTEDKQPVSWSKNAPYITSNYSIKISKGESKEIRMLYKFYQYLNACPPVQTIDPSCVDPKIGADDWGFTCADKRTYGWLCDYNPTHSAQCCACKKKKNSRSR